MKVGAKAGHSVMQIFTELGEVYDPDQALFSKI
jgi:hypothetical protein